MVAVEGHDVGDVGLGGVRMVRVGFGCVRMRGVVAAVVFAIESRGNGGREGGFAGAWDARDGNQESAGGVEILEIA